MSEVQITSYAEDQVVLQQGDRSRCLYKVLSGSVGLFLNYGQKDEYLVGITSAPHCFGEMTVLAGKTNPHTVVALKENTVLMRVPESHFDSFIQDNHQNAIMIMKTMARNLAMVNMNINLLVEELREISKGQTVDEDAVKRLADQYGAHMEIPMLPEQMEDSDMDAVPELPGSGIYPPGHKGYPGITHPEYHEHVYQKVYTCPHCGKTFLSWRILRSKMIVLPEKTGMNRYDRRRFYQNFEPYWYSIVTCPDCCFSAWSDDFFCANVLFKQRYAHLLEQAAAKLKLDFESERDLDFVYTQHYLALICARGLPMEQRRQSVAQLWKNLCWMYEDAGDRELECLAAEQTAQALVELQEHGSPQRHKIYLDIAAMYWKAGNAPQAREWALRVGELSSFGQYSDLSHRLIHEIRESFSMKN